METKALVVVAATLISSAGALHPESAHAAGVAGSAYGDSTVDASLDPGEERLSADGDKQARLKDLTDAFLIGYNARATFANSVALGNGSQASAENTVSVGTVQQQRRIMNVADGIEQTDAVTVHQLSELQSQMLHATNAPRSMIAFCRFERRVPVNFARSRECPGFRRPPLSKRHSI